MPTIVVSGLIEDGDRSLVSRSASGEWGLPGGVLADNETTEEALRRLLLQDFGIQVEQEEFLDTFFERAPELSQPLLRNVYRIERWSGEAALRSPRGFEELAWLRRADLASLPLSDSVQAAFGLVHGRAEPEMAGGAPRIVVLAGPASESRSSICNALRTRLGFAASIDAAAVRAMLPTGDTFGMSQMHDLHVASIVSLARNFVLAGMDVVLNLELPAPELLETYLAALDELSSVRLVNLFSSGTFPVDLRGEPFLSDLASRLLNLSADEAVTVILDSLTDYSAV
jgi:ADP-ribose pyrophosphatase YjhB (NUDIX family)